MQPYNSEVGAGTYNPATFLRALGPEPWNVAFVEPSRRPTDGRYGDNPNRLQQFHQFQVILKPSPLDIQDLYLESLARARHESARSTTCASSRTTGSRRRSAPGASAGRCGSTASEISQFTYFQQVGGIDCKPVSRRAHLRARAHRDVPAGRRQRLRRRSSRPASSTARSYKRAEWEWCDVQLRGGRRRGALRGVRPLRGRRRSASSRWVAKRRARSAQEAWCSPRTTSWSRRRTPSTCSTRAARSASPSAQRFIGRVRALAGRRRVVSRAARGARLPAAEEGRERSRSRSG